MFFYRNVSALTYIAVTDFALGPRYVYNSFLRFFLPFDLTQGFFNNDMLKQTCISPLSPQNGALEETGERMGFLFSLSRSPTLFRVPS